MPPWLTATTTRNHAPKLQKGSSALPWTSPHPHTPHTLPSTHTYHTHAYPLYLGAPNLQFTEPYFSFKTQLISYLSSETLSDQESEFKLPSSFLTQGPRKQDLGLSHFSIYSVGSMDMALPPPVTEDWSASHWPEGMCIVLGMDCNSIFISFWEWLLVLWLLLDPFTQWDNVV